MNYIINSICNGLYGSIGKYGLYVILEINRKKGYIIAQHKTEDTKYKIIVKKMN